MSLSRAGKLVPRIIFAIALSVVGLVGVPVGSRAQSVARPEVVSLRFEGNEAVGERALESAILTRVTSCRFSWLRPLCWLGWGYDREYLSPQVFSNDYLRVIGLYRRLGFRGVQLDTAVVRNDDNTAEITFRIVEGQPHRVTSLTVTGLDPVGDPTLSRDLPIAVGDRLNLNALEAARDTLGQRLRNRGYANVEVLRGLYMPSGTTDAEIEFDVFPGPLSRFGPIEIVRGPEGGELSETVIRRMLPFEEGSLYNRNLIFEAQRNLYALEIVRHATITEDLRAGVGIVPLQLSLAEGDSHRVRTEGGWNTAECFTAESQWSSYNFFGGARRLTVRGTVSNILTHRFEGWLCSGAGTDVYGDPNWRVSLDFNQPFLVTPRYSLSASVFVERQSLQDVFVREAGGLDLGINRTFGRATSLVLSWRPQLARLDAAEIFFCTSFLVCNPEDIGHLQASNWLSPIGAAFFHDRRNRAISPTSGYTFLLDLERAGAWSASDFVYSRGIVELTGFLGLPMQAVLATRLRGGWLRAGAFEGLTAVPVEGDRRIVHPQKRFYAGGANSVRGFAQNQLGPTVASVSLETLLFGVGGALPVCTPSEIADLSCDASALGDGRFIARPTGGSRLIEGSTELRFPVWGDRLSGAAFMDFGQVWDGSGRFDFDRLVFTPGFGLRYATPIGPIRVDVGYRKAEATGRPVVTSQIRAFGAGDVDGDRVGPPGVDCSVSPGMCLDWVRLRDLAPLEPLVPFGEDQGFWNRVQLHISIGQAF